MAKRSSSRSSDGSSALTFNSPSNATSHVLRPTSVQAMASPLNQLLMRNPYDYPDIAPDNRHWNPTSSIQPASSPRGSNRTVARPYKSPFGTLRLAEPDGVALCLRRAQRKQVIFATRNQGKGAKSKHRHRNIHTKSHCR